MLVQNDFFMGKTFFIGSNGEKIPLIVERVDFNPGYIGPEIQGYLLRGSESAFSKKSDSPIKKVIFNDPATIVIWSDDTKTVVKCQEGDTYSKELGLAMCIAKKYLGNKGNFNEEFKKWLPEEETPSEDIPFISIDEMRSKLDTFCTERGPCEGCPLKEYNFKCGRGKTFISNYPERQLSNEAIIKAYELVFNKKED